MLRCHINISTQPPPGSNSVNQPSSQGKQYGPISCPTELFGGGIETDAFTVLDNGDMKGTYVQYFHGGTVKGAFDLTPDQDQPVNDSTFTSQTWTGTLNVVGGSGNYKGITGKTDTSVLKCSTPDEVHLTCTEKVMVKLPPPRP